MICTCLKDKMGCFCHRTKSKFTTPNWSHHTDIVNTTNTIPYSLATDENNPYFPEPYIYDFYGGSTDLSSSSKVCTTLNISRKCSLAPIYNVTDWHRRSSGIDIENPIGTFQELQMDLPEECEKNQQMDIVKGIVNPMFEQSSVKAIDANLVENEEDKTTLQMTTSF